MNGTTRTERTWRSRGILFLLILSGLLAQPALAQDESAAQPPTEDTTTAVEAADDAATAAPSADADEVEAEAEPALSAGEETPPSQAAGEEPPIDVQEGAGLDLQAAIDNQFQRLNNALIPLLFLDVSFGMLDPSVEDIEARLAKAKERVASIEAELTPEQLAATGKETPRDLRIARKAVATAEADLEAKRADPDTTLYSVPLIVIFLAGGGLFFTLRLKFINFRLFAHSFAVIRGKYDNPDDHGEISHFQALTSALSATVGLGNIAGVAVAISMGGPGAVFWMWLVAVLGMSSKFCSCTLAQMYREVEPEDGKKEHVLGGPMVYLSKGVKEQLGGGTAAAIFGKILAISFAIFTICASLGGGNMFQGNQTFAIVSDVALGGDDSYAWVGGLILAALVAVVIIGGIRRIGEVTSKLVPVMCVFYCFVCLIIVLANLSAVPGMIGEIFAAAFTFESAAWGGGIAVFVQGVKRGAFSNEAGLGSAAIAHSAAKTNEPVREGVVAMIGPFIDTILVCTMTALAILITDSHLGDDGGFRDAGISITASAFASLAPWLKYMLTIAVFVFAYSTMISWSYYGERACEYLFGNGSIWPYRVTFIIFVFLGPLVSLSNVITFTDLLILSMAYPNIIGVVILSPKIARAANDYITRLKSGEMKPYEKAKEEIEGQPSI